VPGAMARSGAEMLAAPEMSDTGVETNWPSLAKVMVPVGCGLVGKTLAVKA